MKIALFFSIFLTTFLSHHLAEAADVLALDCKVHYSLHSVDRKAGIDRVQIVDSLIGFGSPLNLRPIDLNRGPLTFGEHPGPFSLTFKVVPGVGETSIDLVYGIFENGTATEEILKTVTFPNREGVSFVLDLRGKTKIIESKKAYRDFTALFLSCTPRYAPTY